MSDPIITQVDTGSVVYDGMTPEDAILLFTGALTVKEGTILARQTVDKAVADGVVTGTGDGTATLVTVVPGTIVPLAGVHTLTCTTAVAEGGVFQMTDPNGSVVASDLVMTPGSGGTTVLEAGGLQFTLTDGAADFIVGDSIALTVVANGKLVPYVVAGAGGEQIPIGIITFAVVATGAGDVAIRFGARGTFRKERVVIQADGDDSNITDAIRDQLRDIGLVLRNVTELNEPDNS